MPKAKPLYRSGSTPQARSTAGLTMPQPPTSIQPSLPHTRQGWRAGSPWQAKHCRSSSALGSVNGKYDGRSRVRVPSPNMAAA